LVGCDPEPLPPLQGWPTAGGPAATPAIAERFMRQLVRAAIGDAGRLSAFVFEAFDETRKAGDGGAGSVRTRGCVGLLYVVTLHHAGCHVASPSSGWAVAHRDNVCAGAGGRKGGY
jgi:hypothetical protein